MKNYRYLSLVSCATLLSLSGPALAGHCDADLATVQQRLTRPTSASANALEAVAALVASATTACRSEETEIAAAPLDDHMRQPDYVTVGRSMLAASLQLIDGE